MKGRKSRYRRRRIEGNRYQKEGSLGHTRLQAWTETRSVKENSEGWKGGVRKIFAGKRLWGKGGLVIFGSRSKLSKNAHKCGMRKSDRLAASVPGRLEGTREDLEFYEEPRGSELCDVMFPELTRRHREL